MSHRLYGPFAQILTMTGLKPVGPLSDTELTIIANGGIVVGNGVITAIGRFDELAKTARERKIIVAEITTPCVLTPGFIDCHTHMIFAGSRAGDYALRVAGTTYLDMAERGGGIMDTVRKTRAASTGELVEMLKRRWKIRAREGVTTCEVKSGYGLSVEKELELLIAISEVNTKHAGDLVPTCLAAHVRPPEFADNTAYLKAIADDLFPEIAGQKLSRRVDIYVDDGAFTPAQAKPYLLRAKAQGFDIVIHADQFKPGGALLAAEIGALSADHLEASTDTDIKALKKSGVIAVALPGASLGLGMRFAPARKILDAGLTLAIASDFNPGSAPMGDLIVQSAVLGAAEKLTLAETFAGVTTRAASALGVKDRGQFAAGLIADMIAFPTDDYREIFYQQGRMKPVHVWKKGRLL